MNPNEPIIQLKGVNKQFGDFKVLREVSLDVHRGETLVIIGRSGVGKSTILKHMAGLMSPDSGEVWVEGQNVGALSEDELNELRKKMGVVFQYAALFDSLTVFENVAFRLLRDFAMTRAQALEVVKQKLELVELKDELMDRKPAQLSGGMRKRVGLARAIAVDPEIILYDEPTSGLDPVTSEAINNLILDMQKKLRVTSVVVTHDMHSAYKVANRIAMIYDGKIIGIGTPDEIKNSQDPTIHQFVTGSVEGPMPIR
ncbi:MAG TPA: ABC transporter ATP-binding protein [bacterium]|jgi:phospholipid/cholesterol/gamma-HCH transport system ATP-binding protein|nr:ABC transporter ATP-binding protein [bacterium]